MQPLRILPAVEDTDTGCAARNQAAREGRDEGLSSLPPGAGEIGRALPLLPHKNAGYALNQATPRPPVMNPAAIPENASELHHGNTAPSERGFLRGAEADSDGFRGPQTFYRPRYRLMDRRSAWRRALRRCLRTALSMALLAPVTLGLETPADRCPTGMQLSTMEDLLAAQSAARTDGGTLVLCVRICRPPCVQVYDPERSRVL